MKASDRKLREKRKRDARAIRKITWCDIDGKLIGEIKPGSKEWDHWREVLSRERANGERRKLVRKLGLDFMSIYAQYRQMIEQRAGKLPRFQDPTQTKAMRATMASEIRLAGDVAMLAVLYDICPVQLLKYWDENVGTMSDQQFPALSFLKSPYAREQFVSTSKDKKGRRSTPPGRKKKRPEMNTYARVEELLPDLRERLADMGFDYVMQYSDRYLLTMQQQAQQLRDGRSFFIEPGRYSRTVRAIVKLLKEEP